MLLLSGKGPEPDQRCLNRTCLLGREDRAHVCRTGNRLLPGLEHLIKLLTDVWWGKAISTHEGVIQVVAQAVNVGATYILCDRIQDVKGG